MVALPVPVPRELEHLVEAGQIAELQGQQERARACYESALYRLRGAERGVIGAALLRWIGRTYLDDADRDAALDCLEAALAVSECIGDESSIAHSLNIIAIVHQRRGNLAEAEQLFRRALGIGRRIGDEKLQAMVNQNLGVIANIHGELRPALRYYRASLEGYKRLGLGDYIGSILNNLGMIYTDVRRWRAAERTFGEAVRVCAARGDLNVQLMAMVNRTEVWIAQGRLDEARAACAAALELAERAGNFRAQSEAYKQYGVISREAGAFDDAERYFEKAIRVAEGRDDPLLEAETLREMAELFWRQERFRETLHSLNRSHGLFEKLRARRDVVDVGRRLGRLESRFQEIAMRWGESIESKDLYTAGHCQRVADYACALARRVGFDDATLFWFRIGAMLHDVGKIVIPDEVLNKPGRLTDEEMAIIRRHPDAGVELLEGIDFPWDILPMVRHHHERWDGQGYPSGLAGEEIPLAARVLGLADVYDALTSERSYRAALTPGHALEVMRKEAGTVSDPALFELFRHVVCEMRRGAVT